MALREHVLALQEGLAAADGWDARYAVFEQWMRFQIYGEPRARAVQPSSEVFYPKFKALKQALKLWEQEQRGESCKEAARKDASKASDDQPFFDSLLPAILQTACQQSASELASACEPLEGAGSRTLTRSQAACYLANAAILNVPRGSALDLYGAGKDPLYCSAGRVAPEKLRCLLCYLHQATAAGWSVADEPIRFERVGGVGQPAGAALTAGLAVETPEEVASAEEQAAAAFPLSESEALEAARCFGGSGEHAGAEGGWARDGLSYPLEQVVVEVESGEAHAAEARALLLPSSASFGGGPPSGLSATEEEVPALPSPTWIVTCHGLKPAKASSQRRLKPA